MTRIPRAALKQAGKSVHEAVVLLRFLGSLTPAEFKRFLRDIPPRARPIMQILRREGQKLPMGRRTRAANDREVARIIRHG